MKRKLLCLLAVGVISFCAMTDSIQAQTPMQGYSLTKTVTAAEVEQMDFEQLATLLPSKDQDAIKKWMNKLDSNLQPSFLQYLKKEIIEKLEN